MKSDLFFLSQRPQTPTMSALSFRLMSLTFSLIDLLTPTVERRSHSFGLLPGSTVIDYGCGPGRYTLPFSRLVGPTGKVYAVDIHELAVEAVQKKIERYGLANVTPVLARGYDSGLPRSLADRIVALDMFHSVRDPLEFLAELYRLLKPDGLLILDDGHRVASPWDQPHSLARQKVLDTGLWAIESDLPDHLECRPL